MSSSSSGPFYIGKARLFIHKLEKPETPFGDAFEVLDSEHFDDRLISDVKEGESHAVLSEEVGNGGFDGFKESINEVLKNYLPGDIVEVLADAYMETYKTYIYDCADYEYDSHVWFENEKHRKLTKEQSERFCSSVEEGFENKAEG